MPPARRCLHPNLRHLTTSGLWCRVPHPGQVQVTGPVSSTGVGAAPSGFRGAPPWPVGACWRHLLPPALPRPGASLSGKGARGASADRSIPRREGWSPLRSAWSGSVNTGLATGSSTVPPARKCLQPNLRHRTTSGLWCGVPHPGHVHVTGPVSSTGVGAAPIGFRGASPRLAGVGGRPPLPPAVPRPGPSPIELAAVRLSRPSVASSAWLMRLGGSPSGRGKVPPAGALLELGPYRVGVDGLGVVGIRGGGVRERLGEPREAGRELDAGRDVICWCSLQHSAQRTSNCPARVRNRIVQHRTCTRWLHQSQRNMSDGAFPSSTWRWQTGQSTLVDVIGQRRIAAGSTSRTTLAAARK